MLPASIVGKKNRKDVRRQGRPNACHKWTKDLRHRPIWILQPLKYLAHDGLDLGISDGNEMGSLIRLKLGCGQK